MRISLPVNLLRAKYVYGSESLAFGKYIKILQILYVVYMQKVLEVIDSNI